MTLTEAMLKKLREALPRIKPLEWKQISEETKSMRAGMLFRMSQSLANVLHGKKMSKSAFAHLVLQLFGILITERVSLRDISAQFRENSITMIKADLALPKIRRSFTSFSGALDEFTLNFLSNVTLESIFLALVELTNMTKSEDLVTDVAGVARSLHAIQQNSQLQDLYRVIKNNAQVSQKERAALLLLRDMAEKHQLVGTLKELPELPNKFARNAPEFTQITDAIIKFPVYEELKAYEHSARSKLDAYLEDMADFFEDYPIGEVRQQGLIDFPKQCRSYAESTSHAKS
jgi:hypothetical protein